MESNLLKKIISVIIILLESTISIHFLWEYAMTRSYYTSVTAILIIAVHAAIIFLIVKAAATFSKCSKRFARNTWVVSVFLLGVYYFLRYIVYTYVNGETYILYSYEEAGIVLAYYHVALFFLFWIYSIIYEVICVLKERENIKKKEDCASAEYNIRKEADADFAYYEIFDQDLIENGESKTIEVKKIEAKTPKRVKHLSKVFLVTLIISLGTVLISIVLAVAAFIMKTDELYFRTWVQIFKVIVLVFGIPVSFFMMLEEILSQIRMKNPKTGRSVIASIGMLLLAGLITTDVFIGSFVLLLIGESYFEVETYISENIIDGTTQEFLGSSDEVDHNYYTTFGPFCKKALHDDESVILANLKNQYGEDFGIKTTRKGASYRAYPIEHPEIEFNVVKAIYYNTYISDYIPVRANLRIKEYREENPSVRTITDIKSEDDGTDTSYLLETQITCLDEDDTKGCAGEVAGMIGYILQDPFFGREGNYGHISVVCGQEANYYNTVTFGYGNRYDNGGMTGYVNGKDFDYYAIPDNVYQELEKCFKDNINTEQYIYNEEETDYSYTEEETEEEPEEPVSEMPDYEDDITTPEGSYKVLYDTIFKPAGDAYECTYNAKGNFYAILGNGEEEIDGEQMTFRRTAVYDRVSENGKCQLFVEYKEYSYKNGEEYNTAIINMYAVNMKTREVITSGKKAWADVGTKEYREATGE